MNNFIMSVMVGMILFTTGITAYAETVTEVSVFSRHVWRGTAGSTAISVQPQVTVPIVTSAGEFSIAAWGSIPITDTGGDTEYDFSVSLPIGKYGTAGVTSYTFGGPILESDTHEVEASFSTSYAGVDILLGNFVSGDRVEGDTYVELGYNYHEFTFAAGAGTGAYALDGDFALVNTSVSVNNGNYGASLVYNPDSETTYFVVNTTW